MRSLIYPNIIIGLQNLKKNLKYKKPSSKPAFIGKDNSNLVKRFVKNKKIENYYAIVINLTEKHLKSFPKKSKNLNKLETKFGQKSIFKSKTKIDIYVDFLRDGFTKPFIFFLTKTQIKKVG